MLITDPIKTDRVLPGIWHATYGDFDLGDPIGTGKTETAAIEDLKQIVSPCDECKGAGQICVGTSGLESDGNAPILELCEACDGSGES